jgi:hypothetical protein
LRCRSCGARQIEHIGSAHEDDALKAAAAERLAAGQTVLDLGVAAPHGRKALPIASTMITHLWEGLCAVYRVLELESATEGDTVCRDLLLARIISRPASSIPPEPWVRSG